MITLYFPHIPPQKGMVLTTGFFDGVHVGHQAVLTQVVQRAKQLNKASCVLTFWPHPRIVLQKSAESLRLLSTLSEKVKQIEELGIDYLVIVPFTLELSGFSAARFFKEYLHQQMDVSALVIGYDHHFGSGAQSGFEELSRLGKQLNILVEKVDAELIDGQPVSSTRIRHALDGGDIPLADKLLNRKYPLSGKVVGGRKIGRTLGFPTANLQVDEPLKQIPQQGVYAAQTEVNGQLYKSIVSIGTNPTIDDKNRSVLIESHLLDFNRDIYGEIITLHFLQKLRNEQKFDSLETLTNAINTDKEQALKVFNVAE